MLWCYICCKGAKAKTIRGGKSYLARETGTVRKKWGDRIPVAVVFPNSYHVGMSNLALHILYRTLNERDDVVCERFFYEEGMPLASVESSRSLSSFEIVFFTLSFELDYPNISQDPRAVFPARFFEGPRRTIPADSCRRDLRHGQSRACITIFRSHDAG